jgi:hypothetical protein
MERYLHILIGLLALGGIAVMIVKRPITPKLSRWLLAHRLLVERVAPFVFIVWGGAIWMLINSKRRVQQSDSDGWRQRDNRYRGYCSSSNPSETAL